MADVALRRIDAKPIAAKAGRLPALAAGPKPQLRWIAVDLLRVDPSYQRDILRRGEANIIRIGREFDWTKFAPVIVAESDRGIYLVLDGQHRATAAALRGIKDVPCAIISGDARTQAAAFAAINAQVTAMSALQLHAARLAAGDPQICELTKVCAAAGVTICRYPVPANKMKPGETLAAGQLTRLLERYGAAVLASALRCITCGGARNTGLVRAQIVEALCAVLEAEPDWIADERRLLKAMARFDFAQAYGDALRSRATANERLTSKLVDAIADYLGEALEAAA